MRRSTRVAVIVALGLVFTSLLIGVAQANPGGLDSSFGSGGKSIVSFGGQADLATAVVIQPDGKIVTVGGTQLGTTTSNIDWTIARFLPDGSLDTSFGGTGKVTTSFGTNDDEAFGVALQPDGKIVVAGVSAARYAVVRYLPNGSLDTTFNTTGKKTFAIEGTYDSANAVAIQSDGKIVLAGQSNNGPGTDVSMARLTSGGFLDTTFDTDGKVVVTGAGGDYAQALAIQPDGNLVVAGYRYPSGGGNADAAVWRFLPNGAPDASFDGDGVAVTPVTPDSDFVQALTLQPDGKIVVAGYNNSGSGVFEVVRYLPYGSLDVTFDNDGIAMTPAASGQWEADGIALQPDGKLVIGGHAYTGNHNDAALARFLPSGALDPGFGTGGTTTAPLSGYETFYGVVALQSDGNIVLAGGTQPNGVTTRTAVARFLGGVPKITVADATVSESAGVATFSVSLSDVAATDYVSVDYSTHENSAKAGLDYQTVSGTLTFAPGQSAKTISVPIVNDSVFEPDETFSLDLANASGGAIMRGSATGVISNDDVPTLVLSTTSVAPKGKVSVSGTSFGSSEAVDVALDGVIQSTVSSGSNGSLATTPITIPAAAAPGAHTISAAGRRTGASAVATLTVETSWLGFHNQANRRGYNSVENMLSTANVSDLEQAFGRGIGGLVKSSPAVQGVSRVFVGTNAGKLYALDAQTGTVSWTSAALGNAVTSSPAIGGSRVFVGAGTVLYAYPMACTTPCSPLATATLAGTVTSPVVSNGIVYVTGGSTLYAFAAGCSGTCTPLWTAALIANGTSPAVADGIVAVGSGSTIEVFDAAGVTSCSGTPKTCSPLFTPATGGTVNSTPTIVAGVIYAGADDSKVYARKASDGTPVWTATVASPVGSSSPAVAGGKVLIGTGSTVVALNAVNGSTAWTYATAGAVSSSPAVAGGVVYVGSADSRLYALSLASGTALWSAVTGGAIASSPAVVNGMVYVGSDDMRLYGYALP